ncbi:hypothetical protein MA04_02736 [Alcanivorax balearicus MACL04]|uniref:Uncharacterized protein n=1 Tax=Alloalcanivorax balearicus MACL04 TaxID=1177182 RepID=A0ABT2R0Y2_9GAMM|nr:hypothetical protein [Alloalcanivorax balearicus MACL04]
MPYIDFGAPRHQFITDMGELVRQLESSITLVPQEEAVFIGRIGLQKNVGNAIIVKISDQELEFTGWRRRQISSFAHRTGNKIATTGSTKQQWLITRINRSGKRNLGRYQDILLTRLKQDIREPIQPMFHAVDITVVNVIPVFIQGKSRHCGARNGKQNHKKNTKTFTMDSNCYLIRASKT